MIPMTRPDGGTTLVHESRLDEYKARGFKVPAPTRAPSDPKKKKTRKE